MSAVESHRVESCFWITERVCLFEFCLFRLLLLLLLLNCWIAAAAELLLLLLISVVFGTPNPNEALSRLHKIELQHHCYLCVSSSVFSQLSVSKQRKIRVQPCQARERLSQCCHMRVSLSNNHHYSFSFKAMDFWGEVLKKATWPPSPRVRPIRNWAPIVSWLKWRSQ